MSEELEYNEISPEGIFFWAHQRKLLEEEKDKFIHLEEI